MNKKQRVNRAKFLLDELKKELECINDIKEMTSSSVKEDIKQLAKNHNITLEKLKKELDYIIKYKKMLNGNYMR